MIERKISRFGVFFLIFLLPLCALAQKGEKIQTIVIDAGHGGKDTGALGKLSKEKDLNLAVALKFGAYIEENLPDVKVIYTRDKDVFVELSERAAIANRNDADVFVSIHCNSTGTPNSALGAETFVMGESKNEKNLEVAKNENAAILLEDNTEAYDNFDPNSTEAYILFSLSQSLYQSQSLDLADKVQKQFASKGRHNRGVQQAGFLVLWKTSMPSILVELGFINNLKEEQFLDSERGQTQMALALYRAFEEYKHEFETENHGLAQATKPKATVQPQKTAKPTQPAKTEKPEPPTMVVTSAKTEQPAKTEKTEKPAITVKPVKVEQPTQPAKTEKPEPPTMVVTSAKTEQPAKHEKAEQPAITVKPVKVEQPEQPAKTEKPEPPTMVVTSAKTEQPAKPERPAITVTRSTNNNDNTYFSVQFSTLDKLVPVDSKDFKGLKDVEAYEYKGAYRYITGRFTTKAEAVARQNEARNLGFKDAFVVGFIDGKRVNLKEAEEALKK